MPKSKIKSHHNGHSVTKGKGSIYQRSALKKEEVRNLRRESTNAPPPDPDETA